MAEKQSKEFVTFEDLVGANRQDEREDRDFAHGQMFALPDWVKWWTARDAWGKPTKKDDAKEHTLDLRVCGFVMDGADYWPAGMRGREGGLVYTFPFTHHRDPNRDRHLCLKPFGKNGTLPGAKGCPRCESFFDMREQTADMADQKAAWEKIKVFGQKFSGLIFGYVDGDTKNLLAFEFSDTKPNKGFEKDPTFFQRIVTLCTDKSIPAASRLDPLFYSYDVPGKPPRAQIIRLKFAWVTPQKGKEYWQLTSIYKVGTEDGAPSTEVDSSVAERIRPWEWMDIEGEAARMRESDGTAEEPKADFDSMDYAALMAFAIKNQMASVLEEGFDADETLALRAAIKKEVTK